MRRSNLVSLNIGLAMGLVLGMVCAVPWLRRSRSPGHVGSRPLPAELAPKTLEAAGKKPAAPREPGGDQQVLARLRELMSAGPGSVDAAVDLVRQILREKDRHPLARRRLQTVLGEASALPAVRRLLAGGDLDPATWKLLVRAVGDSESPEAEALLLELLARESDADRLKAVIAAIGNDPSPLALDALLGLLENSGRSPAIRVLALQSLAKLGGPELEARLVRALSIERDPRVLAALVRTLAAPTAHGELFRTEVLRAHESLVVAKRSAAELDAVRTWVDRGRAGESALVDSGPSRALSPAVRYALTRIFQDAGQSKEARLAALDALLGDRDPGTQALLTHALASERDPDILVRLARSGASPAARDALAAILDNRQYPAEARQRALEGLMGLDDPAAAGVLARVAADNSNPRLRDQAALHLARNSPAVAGILIEGISPDSQAQILGLRPGDILLNHNGQAYTVLDRLRDAVTRVPPHERVTATIYRAGQVFRTSLNGGLIGINGSYVSPR